MHAYKREKEYTAWTWERERERERVCMCEYMLTCKHKCLHIAETVVLWVMFQTNKFPKASTAAISSTIETPICPFDHSRFPKMGLTFSSPPSLQSTSRSLPITLLIFYWCGNDHNFFPPPPFRAGSWLAPLTVHCRELHVKLGWSSPRPCFQTMSSCNRGWQDVKIQELTKPPTSLPSKVLLYGWLCARIRGLLEFSLGHGQSKDYQKQ